jgi:hypothetical protein
MKVMLTSFRAGGIKLIAERVPVVMVSKSWFTPVKPGAPVEPQTGSLEPSYPLPFNYPQLSPIKLTLTNMLCEMLLYYSVRKKFNYAVLLMCFCYVHTAKTNFDAIFPRTYRKFQEGAQDMPISSPNLLIPMYYLIQIKINLDN